jgi:hypothetical protein
MAALQSRVVFFFVHFVYISQASFWTTRGILEHVINSVVFISEWGGDDNKGYLAEIVSCVIILFDYLSITTPKIHKGNTCTYGHLVFKVTYFLTYSPHPEANSKAEEKMYHNVESYGLCSLWTSTITQHC